MDVATIILVVAVINVAVFLAGCSLALARTWRERTPAHQASSGVIADRRPAPGPHLRHAGRRAH